VDLTRNRSTDRYPATSPNGRLVAFSSNRGSSGTYIWVMNVQGRALRQVTLHKGNQFEPTWAPAGGRLAYVSGTLTAGTNLWTVLANGTGNHQLTALRGNEQLSPSWSPDAHSIVYEQCLVSNTGGCALSVLPLGGSPVDVSAPRAPFLDTFDARLDGFGGVLAQDASGAQAVQSDGRIVATVPATAVQSGQYDFINAGWYSKCQLVGDFDAQADYQLLEWPAANGVSAQINAVYPNGPLAMRESQAWGEQYTAWISPVATSLPTFDMAGSLRLQREGNTAASSYLSGSGWVPISSGPTALDPATINLEAQSIMNRFAHREVKIAWDNFRINSGTISCPNTWWVDNSPDWQAAPT
jgi:dipeptidyl aminopeptidase/acylaminoacyl peptidase